MRHLPAILFLSAPLLLADTLTPWQAKAIQERNASIHSIRTICKEVDEILLHLGINDTPDDYAVENRDMPTGNPGETVAEADGGMLFDAANSRVTYINNVRVNDTRAKLRCIRRLYVQLPKSTLSERQETAKDAVEHTVSAPNASSPNQETAEETVVEPLPGLPIADAPTAMASPAGDEPLDITTEEAVIDTYRNCIMLTGSTKRSPGIHIRRGADEMILHPTYKGEPPTIMADANGDIMINCGKLQLSWRDKNGAPCEMITEAEHIYYRAAEHSLLIHGKATLRTPHGFLQFDKGALIALEAASKPDKKNDGFMNQFTNVSIAGVAHAEAWGNVVATTPANPSHPAAEIHGEHLVYSAKTGNCLTEGQHCRIVYGTNSLQTDGALRLEPNGDIDLSGTNIIGSYERPAPQKGKPAIQGTFRTADTLVFSAEEGTISAPRGITLKDAYGDFSCTGPLVLHLRQSSKATAAPQVGNLNLAITRYTDISHARASGNIVAHHGNTPGAPDTELLASQADVNLITGEMTLTAASGSEAKLRMKGYEIAAASSQTPSLVELKSNGDISISGEQINATLQAKEGGARIMARQNLYLNREKGEISLGPNSRITSADGILTANGPLTATLHRATAEHARPILPNFPHLVYNYDGLEKASTSQGGTIRTEQASMQCSGPITVVMNPTPSEKDSSPTASIRHASASGHVALAGKDSAGRIIKATGDTLSLDGATGEKRLSGNKVTLADAYNTHTAFGPGAGVIIDKKNNARITGSRHTTTATRIHDQINQQKKK